MPNDFINEAKLLDAAVHHEAAVHHDAAGPIQPHSVSDLRRIRIGKRESQEKFWGRFGVTQSSGSRFETGLAIPAPVALLLKLYVSGKLSDGDLRE